MLFRSNPQEGCSLDRSQIPLKGVGGFVHRQPTLSKIARLDMNDPTAVGGSRDCEKESYLLRQDMNDPPTAIGGIRQPLSWVRF
jgi:hypothetical protein